MLSFNFATYCRKSTTFKFEGSNRPRRSRKLTTSLISQGFLRGNDLRSADTFWSIYFSAVDWGFFASVTMLEGLKQSDFRTISFNRRLCDPYLNGDITRLFLSWRIKSASGQDKSSHWKTWLTCTIFLLLTASIFTWFDQIFQEAWKIHSTHNFIMQN